jgi:Arc/MetJ family transcription regulator
VPLFFMFMLGLLTASEAYENARKQAVKIRSVSISKLKTKRKAQANERIT